MLRRAAPAGILGALACVALFATTSTAQGPILNVKVSEERGGGYGTLARVNVDKNEKVSLFYRVKNVSPGELEFSFDDDAQKIPEDLSIKWFEGKTDITHDVQTAGYEFSLDSGKSKIFQAKVKAEANNIKHCVLGHGSYNSLDKYAYGGVNTNCAT